MNEQKIIDILFTLWLVERQLPQTPKKMLEGYLEALVFWRNLDVNLRMARLNTWARNDGYGFLSGGRNWKPKWYIPCTLELLNNNRIDGFVNKIKTILKGKE